MKAQQAILTFSFLSMLLSSCDTYVPPSSSYETSGSAQIGYSGHSQSVGPNTAYWRGQDQRVQQANPQRNETAGALLGLGILGALMSGSGGGDESRDDGPKCEYCNQPAEFNGRWCAQHAAAVQEQMNR